MLLFQRFIFSLDVPITPAALRVRTLIPMEHSVLGTSIAFETFLLHFVPMTTFELTFLPPQQRQRDETPEQFAARVQRLVAQELRVPATTYSFKDALQLRKARAGALPSAQQKTE